MKISGTVLSTNASFNVQIDANQLDGMTPDERESAIYRAVITEALRSNNVHLSYCEGVTEQQQIHDMPGRAQ